MLAYIEKYSILSDQQYGFQKGRLTSLALIELYEKVSSAIDNKKITIGLFLDLSKAFDTVDHNILFSKLGSCNGFWGLILNCLKSYLIEHSLWSTMVMHCSESTQIICRVPQGSILGPLLLFIYMNALCNVSKILELILFADDTNIFYSHENIFHLAHMFNLEI